MSSPPCVAAYIAACCSVMQCASVCCRAGVSGFRMQCLCRGMLQCVGKVNCHIKSSLCYSMLQCDAVCCSAGVSRLECSACVAECRNVLMRSPVMSSPPCVAVCGVLQCVVVQASADLECSACVAE